MDASTSTEQLAGLALACLSAVDHDDLVREALPRLADLARADSVMVLGPMPEGRRVLTGRGGCA